MYFFAMSLSIRWKYEFLWDYQPKVRHEKTGCTFVCIYVCMYVFPFYMYVCIYIFMYAGIFVSNNKLTLNSLIMYSVTELCTYIHIHTVI